MEDKTLRNFGAKWTMETGRNLVSQISIVLSKFHVELRNCVHAFLLTAWKPIRVCRFRAALMSDPWHAIKHIKRAWISHHLRPLVRILLRGHFSSLEGAGVSLWWILSSLKEKIVTSVLKLSLHCATELVLRLCQHVLSQSYFSEPFLQFARKSCTFSQDILISF